jgi:hypothetical protein
MSWSTRFPKPFHAWVLKNRAARRGGRKRWHSHPAIEDLEGRIVLSTLTDGGSTTLTIALASNETFGIQSAGSSYDFTLGSTGTFSNGGVPASDFSGFGTSSLTMNSSGIAHYTTINITDADVSVGATATSVTLVNSGTNTYSTSIDVTVDQNPQPTDVTINSSTFTGSAGLDVTTTGSLDFNSGGGVTTASGPITLAGGTAETLGFGTGVNILSSITSTNGDITITGSSTQQPGVLVSGPGVSVTTVNGKIAITGTTTSTYAGNSGIDVFSGSTISTTATGANGGSITIDGTDTGAGGGAGISIVGGSTPVTFSTAGTGAGAGGLTINGSSAGSHGIFMEGPNTTLTTVDGNIAITGTAGSGSSGGHAGVYVNGAVTINSTGTDDHAGTISITGTSTGGADGVDIYNYVSNGTYAMSISSVGVGANAGSITVTGTSSQGNGIYIQGHLITMTSVDGNIGITGTTSSTNGGAPGIQLIESATISTTGTGSNAGSITINGTDTGAGPGVVVGSTSGGTASVTSVDGPISVKGSATSNDAVQVNAEGTLQASGAGTIQVTTTKSNLTINGGTITTVSGFLKLTASQNIELMDDATVSSSKNNATILAGDNVTIDDTSSLGAPASGFSFSITGGNAGKGGTVTVLGTLLGGSPGQILGGNGNDTLIITPVSSTGFSVSGGTGNDFITIDPQSVTGPVNVNEAAGAGTDTLTLQGSASADAFSVGGLATIVAGHVVTYTPYIASIFVQGLASNDTFLVSPSTAAPITIEGGTTGTPTNALTVFQPQGQTTTLTDQTATSGTYVTTGGYQNVSYTGIQTLAPPNDALPAVTGVTFYYGNGQSFTVQNALPRDLPWQVTAIAFTFNEPVNATLNSLSFTGIGIPVLQSLSGNGTSTLTWTFVSPVTASNVVATLASSGTNAVTSVTGDNPLNGNTATSGANPFDIAVEILYGDVDGDGVVSSRDATLVLYYLATHTGPIAPNFLDVTGNGAVILSDYNAVNSQLGHTI